ncbi:DUF6308 family protein [Streptomyces sp. NPDC005548]|uniref:DUF6308 family protein n=1 Tax=Streptomyces sp. NPDC005548 TaxID=3364724 RepID=UPI0036B5710C
MPARHPAAAPSPPPVPTVQPVSHQPCRPNYPQPNGSTRRHLRRDPPDVGWVIAGKFLARKRPQLLRVCERVVCCAVGRPPSFWLALYTALQEDGAVLHRRLLGLREVAGVPETVSALREANPASSSKTM